VSADGRYVAFTSSATNLHPSDTDTSTDVFVRDVISETITLVSRATGASGAKGNGSGPAISADGRYVAFSSPATNLHPADSDTLIDIFVRDLVANTTTLVSRADGVNGAKSNGASSDMTGPAISADGRYVAFPSMGTNLDAADTDTFNDVYVRDVIANTTTLVSRATGAAGVKSNSGSAGASVSGDGRHVAFGSFATNLDPAATNGSGVYVRDLATDTTTLVSRGPGATGPAGDGGSWDGEGPSISGDGRFVAFASNSTNLHPDDTSGDSDVFVRDVTSNTNVLVSRSAVAGAEATGFEPSISADGRFVSFRSSATTVHPDDTDAFADIFVRDIAAGVTKLVSRASGANGAKANNHSFNRNAISADGRYVAYFSWASNLHPEDTDGLQDVFMRDVRGPQPPPAITIGDVRLKEGKAGVTRFVFTVKVRGTPPRTVRVDYSTVDGTAKTSDNDYRSTNGTLAIAPWEGERTITVDVTGDKKKEATETFSVLLFNASGAQIADDTGLGTIVNDDKKKRRR
jgi:hypothetical protein